MRILAIQPHISPSFNSKERNDFVDGLAGHVEESLQRNRAIDLVVLPELTTIEYSEKAFCRLDELSEEVESYTFRKFSCIAEKYGLYISVSIPRKEAGKYFISNLIINSRGILETCYDKVHLCQIGSSREKDFFTPGNHVGIFELHGIRVGVIICYDFRFSDYLSHLVRNFDVDFILHPVAFTTDATFASWHSFVITRALENQIFFLSLNRAGGGWGNSIFCPPWVDEKSNPELFGENEEERVFDISVQDVRSCRRLYNLSGDRLPDYRNLKNFHY